MAIIYELNPPRLDYGRGSSDVRELLDIMTRRASKIIRIADGIHVTDAVLGTRRLDALESCQELRHIWPDVQITMSIRTRDSTFDEVAKRVDRAARAGVSGVLLVRGDPAQYKGAHDSDLYPSATLARLRSEHLTAGISMLLSLAPDQNWAKTEKKIAARPDGFITQVISSADAVCDTVSKMRAHGIYVIPCVMLPSPKNAQSARSLGLDWSGYEQDAAAFVRKIEQIAGRVLVTSPCDIAMAESIMRGS